MHATKIGLGSTFGLVHVSLLDIHGVAVDVCREASKDSEAVFPRVICKVSITSTVVLVSARALISAPDVRVCAVPAEISDAGHRNDEKDARKATPKHLV